MKLLPEFIRPNWKVLILGFLGLCTVYVLKHQLNVWAWLHGEHRVFYDTTENLTSFPAGEVILNKSVRYLLNDLFSIMIIHGIFQNQRYTKFAFGLLLFGMLVLLPLYFLLVYYAPDGYTSMVANVHRIVLNPVLMMLLIPYLYHMERQKNEKKGAS
ncbi:exosortase F system-associated membrane protein [Phaeocystidibacter luteus]|uniref:Exosortase F system-associated protein n=1 Tax=Phaeocystidibacter luteus TaxID=911197 RepID=A0A6N6RLR6_9FLAO|nr:exosortase F system-associated protein [Phaeocystidibacter luteus]KAB2814507.1 exosortase F system-associated protein [Phaeocystidibacter luteus]